MPLDNTYVEASCASEKWPAPFSTHLPPFLGPWAFRGDYGLQVARTAHTVQGFPFVVASLPPGPQVHVLSPNDHPKPPKSGLQVGGGGLGGCELKTHWGMRLLDKMKVLQGVKLTIQPLGVGYANRPKKAQKGGVCGVFPYIRLLGLDLTTSAR